MSDLPKHRRFNILSLDGGGVRGVVEATILTRLVKKYPNLIRDTDLLAGTSTGAIQALGLAAGFTPHDLTEMYMNLMKYVFADSLRDDFRDLWKMSGADYSNKNLRHILNDQFGDMQLVDLDKKVVVPAFRLDNGPNSKKRSWKLKVFHNFAGSDSDGQEKVVDVALRSAAAPVYFPTYQGYIDGGVVANNPSMVAIAQALDSRSAGVPLDVINLLSIGAGFSGRWIKGQNHDWGALQWAPHILFIPLEGSVSMTDFQCKQLLGWKESYYRINPVLPEKLALDDWKKVPRLMEIAREEDLSEAYRWIKEVWL
ncbi:MAG: hypothetical protein GF334_02990 [Candidatus Altiarchaeales archaeon]|nr:hypothetical protein [Candidatus Altiarchaeales archaeon]